MGTGIAGEVFSSDLMGLMARKGQTQPGNWKLISPWYLSGISADPQQFVIFCGSSLRLAIYMSSALQSQLSKLLTYQFDQNIKE